MKPLDEALRETSAAAFDRFLTHEEQGPLPSFEYPTHLEKDALLTALRALSDAGYVLVPREATKDMIAIGKIAAVTTHRVDQVYESMVAAAPKPTGQGGGG